MVYKYKTNGTCSQEINFEVNNGVVNNVEFIKGCNGNLKGVGVLVEGMKLEDVIVKLKGLECGSKATSCPDQLARALEGIKNQRF